MGVTPATSVRELDPKADWGDLRIRLHSFVASRVPPEGAIHDDLVQEILIRLHRGLPKLRDNERLDAFAYQIARNAIADHYRSRRPEQPVAPETLDDRAAEGDENEEASDEGRAQLARCLHPLIDRLDDDYREAILLTDLGNLSQAEAAKRLGLSAPGMRSRVQRGRAQVQEQLAKCCRVELDAADQIGDVERVGRCACNS
jgi:RNA polymerase sigma-70 factor (ECF subfamily)